MIEGLQDPRFAAPGDTGDFHNPATVGNGIGAQGAGQFPQRVALESGAVGDAGRARWFPLDEGDG
ncbi:hypothetical protein RZS08_21175, partial [Arthrospira platensis SPKY1]|nr:hypothetical protein [Arthrospira platensis SPKY1]